MKEATLWFETTLASHSLTPRTSSSISICISSFTLTWQLRRIFSLISFLEKCGSSVGRILPPPSCTLQVHWIQVPPPPQAEAKNIFSLLKVFKRVSPAFTSSTLSPLIVILSLPGGEIGRAHV